STFYSEPAIVEELYTGYLLKSPAQPISWKRRFFVLSKMGEDYQLTYHANNETKEIDLSKISLLRIGPEAHQKWDWIQKNFKCSPSSVLFLKVEDDTPKHSRDYFLIGENRFATIIYTIFLIAITTMKATSEPVKSSEPKVEDQPDDRRSAPELMLTYPSPYSHYDYPRKLSEPPVPVAFKVLHSYTHETHTHVEKEICVSQNDLKNSLILTQAEGKPCVSDCRMIQDSCLFHKGDQILAFNDLLIDTVEEIQMYLRRLSKDEVKLTIRRLI
uniref:PH domain-containing protein n=1 Tax=Sinocyclocheilus grahami TaxID=75366 RepID=A0A672KTX2_SINGR